MGDRRLCTRLIKKDKIYNIGAIKLNRLHINIVISRKGRRNDGSTKPWSAGLKIMHTKVTIIICLPSPAQYRRIPSSEGVYGE